MGTIPELYEKGKVYREEILIGAIIFLVATASFGLGRLSVVSLREPVEIVYSDVPIAQTKADRVVPTDSGAPLSTPATTQTASALLGVPTQGKEDSRVVASKNGSVYHFPWCAGALKMKEENKVWYVSPEAAKAAGLHPAANCKGLP